MDLLHIEDCVKHQDNIQKAKTKYGLKFYCKIIYTKYFGDDEDIATLVCYDDPTIILGKPRYIENFTKEKYLAKLYDPCELHSDTCQSNNIYFIQIIGELTEIKLRLEKMNDISKKLYEKCMNSKCENLPDPVNWIYNQDNMRKAWEQYINKNSDVDIPIYMKNLMLNNDLTNYMGFMYKYYPSGFGNKMKQAYVKKETFDGAKIYYDLNNI